MFLRHNSRPIGSGWQGMSSAPRDGTTVELCCTYGVAPWYGIFRWTDEMEVHCTEGGTDAEGKHYQRDLGMILTKLGEPTWVDVRSPGHYVSDENHLHWRLTQSSAHTYVDPTDGAQDTPEYWRRACGF